MSLYRLIPTLFASLLALAPALPAQIGAGGKPVIIRQPKNPDREALPNQQREAPAAPPMTASADSSHLVAYTAPLNANGLLTPQTRDAVRWVLSQSHGAPVVHLRAFVVGTGDVRRVSQIVGEIYTEHHLTPPTLTVIQAGALPLDNAQILLQAVVQSSRAASSAALVYSTADGDTPHAAVAKLKQAGALLQTTCYVPFVESLAPIEGVDFVQPQRAMRPTAVHCEALVRTSGAAETLLFTSAQIAFGESDEQATLATARLEKALNAANSSLRNAIAARAYPLSLNAERAATRALAAAGVAAPRANVLFEALPSLDGAWAVDAITRVNSIQTPR